MRQDEENKINIERRNIQDKVKKKIINTYKYIHDGGGRKKGVQEL